MYCEKCGFINCPMLNITECPIYQLWEEADQLDITKRELLSEAETLP